MNQPIPPFRGSRVKHRLHTRPAWNLPAHHLLSFQQKPSFPRSPFVDELEQLARMTAGRSDLRLVVGEAGSGWSWNQRTHTISVDGGRLGIETADFTRGLVLHESAHAAITRLSEIAPQSIIEDWRLFSLLNLLQDCRIETWMQVRFPGCTPWVREYNDSLFRPLAADKEQIPLAPQFLKGIASRWWFKKDVEPMDDKVCQAVDAVWPAFQEILQALPSQPRALGGVSEAYPASAVSHCYAARDHEHPPDSHEQAVRLAQYRMWSIVHRDILPVFQQLLPPGALNDRWLKIFFVRFLQAMPGQHRVGSLPPGVEICMPRYAGEEPGRELGTTGLGSYNQAWRRQFAAIEQVAESLLRWFQTTKRTRFRDGCPWGTRVLLRAAMRFEADPRAYDRLWRRPLIPKKISAHFSLVVDRSGSMDGENIQETFHGVVLLSEVCQRAGVPLNIYAFAGEAERLLEHHEPLSDAVRARLGTLPEAADGGTNLAGALELVAADLAGSPFRDRFVFVLSDGVPHDALSVQTQIMRLAGEGIVLIGLGLGPETQQLADFFEVSRVNLTAKELPGVLAQLLARCLASR